MSVSFLDFNDFQSPQLSITQRIANIKKWFSGPRWLRSITAAPQSPSVSAQEQADALASAAMALTLAKFMDVPLPKAAFFTPGMDLTPVDAISTILERKRAQEAAISTIPVRREAIDLRELTGRVSTKTISTPINAAPVRLVTPTGRIPKPTIKAFVVSTALAPNLIEEKVAIHEHNVIARNNAAILSQPVVQTVQTKILKFMESFCGSGVTVERMCKAFPEYTRSTLSSRVSELVRNGQLVSMGKFTDRFNKKTNHYTLAA
jgi:hypothetical protein